MMKKAIFIIITLVLAAFMVYFMITHRSILIEHIGKRPSLVLWIGILFSVGRVLDALVFKVAAVPFGLKMSVSEVAAIAFCVPLYNHIFPYGGIITKLAYFKKKQNISAVHLVLAQSAKLMSAVVTNCLLGMAVLWLVFFRKGEYFGFYFFAVYLAIFAASVTLLFIPNIKIERKSGFQEFLKRIFEAWHTLRRRRGALFLMIGIQLLAIFIFALRYLLVFRLLSIEASYIGLLAVIPASNLSNSVNLVPGNLGFRELVLSLGAKVLGFDFVRGMLSAMVDRVIISVVVFMVGGWLHIKFGYRIATNKKE